MASKTAPARTLLPARDGCTSHVVGLKRTSSPASNTCRRPASNLSRIHEIRSRSPAPVRRCSKRPPVNQLTGSERRAESQEAVSRLERDLSLVLQQSAESTQ